MDAILRILTPTAATAAQSATPIQPRTGTVKQEASPAATKRDVPNEEILAAAERISARLAQSKTSVTFSVDKDLGRVVVKVINPETHEVVRQIPQEEFLDLARQMDSLAPEAGILTDSQA